jgi:hypothetical protein
MTLIVPLNIFLMTCLKKSLMVKRIILFCKHSSKKPKIEHFLGNSLMTLWFVTKMHDFLSISAASFMIDSWFSLSYLVYFILCILAKVILFYLLNMTSVNMILQKRKEKPNYKVRGENQTSNCMFFELHTMEVLNTNY